MRSPAIQISTQIPTEAIKLVEPLSQLNISFACDKMLAGYPSLIEPYATASLDINEYLITHPVATL